MLPHLENRRPRIAVLGTHLALYAEAYADYAAIMHDFIDRELANLGDTVDVVATDITCTADAATGFVRQAEALGADALVLISAGYTNSLSVTPALCDTTLPLVVLNTQAAWEVTESFLFDDLLLNHGMQGVQDITSVLVRENRPFLIVTGRLSEENTRTRMMDCLIACRARAQVRGRRIAWLTSPQWGMGDGLVTPEQLSDAFGMEAFEIPCGELAALAESVSSREMSEARQFDETHFAIDASVSREDHDRSLRLEVALRKLVAGHSLSGLTFSFDHIATAPGIETIPFLGITKLMGEGLAYGGEGDLLVTAWTAMAHCLGDPVSFTELYTMDFAENSALCTHMAELNWRLARRGERPRLLAHTFSLAPCAPFCSLMFTLEPGPALLSALTLDGAGAFRMITMDAEVTDFPLLTDTWERPNYKVRFARDIRAVMDDYALAGGPHHLCIAPGVSAPRYRAFAELCGLDWRPVTTGSE